MKKLELRSDAYKTLLAQFKRELQTLNYSKDTVLGSGNAVKEYLYYLESRQIKLSENTDLNPFFSHLQKRTNQKRGAGLSIAYLHKYRSFLKLFYDFLERAKDMLQPKYPVLPKPRSNPKVLSVDEVKRLFKACDESLLGKRNKAVLAIYYGLGLRRKEGVNLKVEDLDFGKDEVLITQSKTNQQRLVPMSDHVKNILDDYLFNVREKLVPQDKSTSALLVTDRGKPLSDESVSYIVRKLVKDSKIKTRASSHTLRHSIATHLLHSGMKLESIALFLGHKSLDSTQIYTHLSAEVLTEMNLKNEDHDTI